MQSLYGTRGGGGRWWVMKVDQTILHVKLLLHLVLRRCMVERSTIVVVIRGIGRASVDWLIPCTYRR